MKSIFVLFSSLFIGINAFCFDATAAGLKRTADQPNISKQVLNAFKEHFPKAEQVAWEEQSETYIVNFVEKGIRSHIVYNKEGDFVSSIRYYQEQDLPNKLQNILKKRVADKTVFSVTEMTTELGIEYYVRMEDAQNWLTVRLDNSGGFQVTEQYRKGS